MVASTHPGGPVSFSIAPPSIPEVPRWSGAPRVEEIETPSPLNARTQPPRPNPRVAGQAMALSIRAPVEGASFVEVRRRPAATSDVGDFWRVAGDAHLVGIGSLQCAVPSLFVGKEYSVELVAIGADGRRVPAPGGPLRVHVLPE